MFRRSRGRFRGRKRGFGRKGRSHARRLSRYRNSRGGVRL